MQEGLELRVDESEHHHTGLGFDMGENPLQLTLGADQRPQVLDRIHALELRRRRARYGDAGLAGGVRDQMQMKPSHEPATSLRVAFARARILNAFVWEISWATLTNPSTPSLSPAYPNIRVAGLT